MICARAPFHIIYPQLVFLKTLLLCCLLVLPAVQALAHSNDDDAGYDEVSVMLTVPRIGSIEIPALIHKEEAFLPIKDLFDFLKIKNDVVGNFDTIRGFLISPSTPFLLDKINLTLTFDGKVTRIATADLVKTETNLYIRSAILKQLFGLDCVFTFRSLSLTLTTQLELPAIREMQQEQMRKNIGHLKGERKADTVVAKKFVPFSIGMADWAFNTVQESRNKDNVRLSLGLGGIIAGGEASALLNYANTTPFSGRDQYYRWRYVNNNSRFIKQVIAGKVLTQSLSTLNGPVTGIQFTNTATTYRRSFGSYTLSNTTQPGWTVELYVNNVLINYTRADASGFYTFEVPMMYGTTAVQLRFYSQWGEEQVTEQVMSIPFNFMAAKQFEYNLTAGVLSNPDKRAFSRLSMNYGLSSRITIGGGMEYLSAPAKPSFMPFVNTSIRLQSNLLFSGEHILDVRSKASLNYRTINNLQVDVGYTHFNRDQNVIFTNTLHEKKATVSLPFKRKKLSGFSRLMVSDVTWQSSKNAALNKRTSVEYMLSSAYKSIGSNFTTLALFNTGLPAEVISNLSLSFRLPASIRLTPQVQYDFRRASVGTLKAEAEKSVFKRGFITIAWEKNFIMNFSSGTVGLRYNFNWGQAVTSAMHSTMGTSIAQAARGSLIYDSKTGYATASSQSSVGRGGLIVYAFVDVNGNGKQDENEPRAEGLNLRAGGGKLKKNEKDTSLIVSGLEAWSDYMIEVDKNCFDNIAWRVKKPLISVAIQPNYFREIAVPVSVLSEVSGMVYSGDDGIARMIVGIYNSNNELVTKILTETDGYFSYLGLLPGAYVARVDEAQLNRLNMTASSPIPFVVIPTKDGIVIDNMEFTVKGKQQGK